MNTDWAAKVPNLPFEDTYIEGARISPFWEQVDEKSRSLRTEWLGPLTAIEKERLRGIDCARVACQAFPDSDPDDLVVFTIICELSFLFDDRIGFDEYDSLEDLQSDISRCDRILETGQAETIDPGLENTMAKCLQRIYPRQSHSWRRRIRQNFLDCILAMGIELDNRREGHVPGRREYISMRRNSVAMYLCLDLAEFMLRIELSDTLYDSVEMCDLRESWGDIAAWVNDMASYHKEDAAGEVNLIHVVRAEKNLSVEAAFDEVADMIESRATDFIEAERSLKDSALYINSTASERDAVDIMVQTCRNTMGMYVRHHRESPRYASQDSEV
ncbi:terpene synthase family protein [Nocardia sp. NBC_01730]|uniref:terpene synthase family protein n=1 Tax=Nocardia sp. NBC_01730 TaxID=2975998 RepID=UPI002E1011EE|nr:terpene synthase family protein [Nocardia sp. NBC_01730]